MRLLCEVANETLATPELRSRYPQSPPATGSDAASLITRVADRAGHDRRYAIDCRKIERDLGYRATVGLEAGIRDTFRWFLDNQAWWQAVLDGSYREWLAVNYDAAAAERRMTLALLDEVGDDLLRAQVCIIGAGAAGCATLASELDGAGLRVLVIEAGGLQPDNSLSDYYAGKATAPRGAWTGRSQSVGAAADRRAPRAVQGLSGPRGSCPSAVTPYHSAASAPRSGPSSEVSSSADHT